MRNLIIDLEKHFPSSERIFHPADYFSPKISPNEMIPLQPLPDDEYCRNTYNIDPIINIDDIRKQYNFIIIVWPIHSFNDEGYTTNIIERREFFKKIYDKLETVNFNKIIYFDGSDRAIIRSGLEWMVLNNLRFDVIFKREYRKEYLSDYDGFNIHPFPFSVFGRPNPAIILYENKKINQSEKINSCFWAGTPIFKNDINCPDEYCDRLSILNKSYHHLHTKAGLSHNEFLNEISKYKFFLNLNGTGHLCKRFFEGLSTGSLMMMQRTDLIFPFDEGDYFSEETLFSSADELIEKLSKLKFNEMLYNTCLSNQTYLIDKYFNYEWIRNYIHSKI